MAPEVKPSETDQLDPNVLLELSTEYDERPGLLEEAYPIAKKKNVKAIEYVDLGSYIPKGKLIWTNIVGICVFHYIAIDSYLRYPYLDRKLTLAWGKIK